MKKVKKKKIYIERFFFFSGFQNEARELIRASIHDEASVENIALQLNAQKFAYNMGFGDCAAVILITLLDEIRNERETNLVPALKKVGKNNNIIFQFIFHFCFVPDIG
jgi:hypothetical protein